MARKRGRPKTKQKAIIKYRKSKPKVKYRTRYVAKKVRRQARPRLMGALDLRNAMKAAIPLTCGMLTAKFAAKKFADGGAETENWSWKNYAWGAVGATIGAMGIAALFRKTKSANYFLLGGLGLVAYKIFCMEIAPKSQYLESWFGQDEDIYPDMNGYGQAPGDMWDGGQSQYVMGADGAWRPVDESHRMVGGIGAEIVPSDPTFGAEIVPSDPTFGKTLEDQYNSAYQ